MMLSLVEAFLGRTRTARSNADIVAILGQLATDFGFRSAYLVEYGMALNTAVQVLDSDPDRIKLWDGYFASGIRPSTRIIGETLHRGGVQHFDLTPSDLPNDPLRRSMTRLDVMQTLIVPISFDDEVMGLVGMSGQRRLSSDEERAQALDLMTTVGTSLVRANPLGFGNSGLLVSLHNNCPNNTLPAFWAKGKFAGRDWLPLFERSM